MNLFKKTNRIRIRMKLSNMFNVFNCLFVLTNLTVQGLWSGVAECAAILHINFWLFLIPLSTNTPQLSPLPISFHLLLCSTALICTTALPACDYDQEVTMDYEIHNALDILWASYEICAGANHHLVIDYILKATRTDWQPLSSTALQPPRTVLNW